jgi:putative ubiquitin-RnfH superfamily antitoxin RatB of RatAB toxin-antitoxin module
MKEARISVEVATARPERQIVRRVSLASGGTVSDAIRASGLLEEFPGMDASRVGIYGRRVVLAARVRDGDRVEIYRALEIDPKETRRRRAAGRRATTKKA